jgi:hypothetical protein
MAAPGAHSATSRAKIVVRTNSLDFNISNSYRVVSRAKKKLGGDRFQS